MEDIQEKVSGQSASPAEPILVECMVARERLTTVSRTNRELADHADKLIAIINQNPGLDDSITKLFNMARPPVIDIPR